MVKMASASNFSRVRSFIHICRCTCQSGSVALQATSRRYHYLQPNLKSPIARFSSVRQQSSLPCHIRLLSTKAHAKSREGEDTLISQLPYSFLHKVPGMGYMAILNEVAVKIQKGLPLQRYYFCHFMRQIDNQKKLNSAEAKTWLDSTGITCLAFSDTERAEFTRWMWNKIQEIGDQQTVQKDVNLFNRYLKVMLDNKSPLTPSEIAAEMEAKQYTPNQITYLMLVASACEQGDMTEAREQLAKMKSQGFVVSTHLYNSLMRGYCKAGYVEKAEEMLNSMSTLNLEANDMTYANLLLAYAERGDVTKIKRILAEMDEKGYALITNKALEMVTVLANGGFVLEAEQVFEMIKNKIGEPSLVNLSTALKALLENGHTDLALKVFVSMGKTARALIDIALLCKLPVDELVKLVKRCKELKMGNVDDGYIVREAGNLAEFDTAVELYKRTDKVYTPKKDSLYPVIDYYCSHGTLDEILTLQPLIEKMTTWDICTAMESIYPAMKKLGKTCEEVVQILRAHSTLDEGEFNTIVVRTLLCKESLPLTKAEVEKMTTVEHILLSPLCNPAMHKNFLKKPEDWKQVLEFVVEVQKKRKVNHNFYGVFGAIKSKFSEADLSLEPVVDFMIEHDLKCPMLDVPGVPEEKWQKVHISQPKAKNYLPELEQQYPYNPYVLRHHLKRAAIALDKRTVDGICRLRTLQRDTFVDIPCELALIRMYIILGDAENAVSHTKHIQDRIPNFQLLPQYGLALADILFKEKRYEDAFDILSITPRKIKDDFHMNERDSDLYVNSLQSLKGRLRDPEVNKDNRLMEILVENNHMNKKTMTRAVQPKTLDSQEAINQKLASEQEIQRLTMDDVQKIFEYFIKHDNKEDLQKASDLFSKHKDSERVLYRLCAAFAVEGKLLQARKVLQQPGMQVNKEELKDICNYFMKERTNIKYLENFQNVLKDTGYRFDPSKEVLFTIFRKTVLLDLAKGLEFLETGFIFHGEETPRRAYSYLAKAYKSAGKAVPFKIPFDMAKDSTKQKRQTRKRPIMSAATDSGSQGTKQTAPKSETKKKPENLSKETGESAKNSAVIEAPVSDVIEKSTPLSDVIEKSEEVQAVLEQADPAVEITEIKESTKEVLNPVGEEIKDVMAKTDTAEEISVK